MCAIFLTILQVNLTLCERCYHQMRWPGSAPIAAGSIHLAMEMYVLLSINIDSCSVIADSWLPDAGCWLAAAGCCRLMPAANCLLAAACCLPPTVCYSPAAACCLGLLPACLWQAVLYPNTNIRLPCVCQNCDSVLTSFALMLYIQCTYRDQFFSSLQPVI